MMKLGDASRRPIVRGQAGFVTPGPAEGRQPQIVPCVRIAARLHEKANDAQAAAVHDGPMQMGATCSAAPQTHAV